MITSYKLCFFKIVLSTLIMEKKLNLIKIFSYSLFVCFFASFCFAHQPRLIYQSLSSESSPYLIYNPDISQAFYWQLKWSPDYFSFHLDKEITWYISLTVPDISWATKNYSFELKKDWMLIANIDWVNFQRSEFYEKFAWDNYFQWPEIEQIFSSWDYFIKIFNHNNQWKYVLAIWKIESFPFNEIINTYRVMPNLKLDYFWKTFLNLFNNYVWWAFLLSFLLICVLILVIMLVIKKIYKRK